MIVTGGYNVYPREVEDALAAQYGGLRMRGRRAPDDTWVEAVVAFVRERLAGYKVPKRIERLDALPKSPFGKILRRALREPLWTHMREIGAHDESSRRTERTGHDRDSQSSRRRNAVDRETAEALAAAFRAFDADAEARVGVLWGAHGISVRAPISKPSVKGAAIVPKPMATARWDQAACCCRNR